VTTCRGSRYRRTRHLLIAIIVSLVAVGAANAPASAATFVPDNEFGIHSMLQLGTPLDFKRQMFAEAAASGASEIRVDVSLGALFNPWISSSMWSALDDYMKLSEQYQIRVLIDLNASNDPQYETCPAGVDPSRGTCAVTNLYGYYAEVAALVQHTAGVIDDFEIVNEPDGAWAFNGTPQQYAGMLSTAYGAVHDNDPNGRVVLGGIMTPNDGAWLSQVFATQPFDAAHKFDIANVHLRDTAANLPGEVLSWRQFFAVYGDGTVPLWVTETGYPSDPAYQYDPAFRGTDAASGLQAQAAFISKALPGMIYAGAAKIFVSERDNLTGPYASEGLLGGDVSDSDVNAGNPVPKPAFYSFQYLTGSIPPAAGPPTPPAPPTPPTPPAPAPPPLATPVASTPPAPAAAPARPSQPSQASLGHPVTKAHSARKRTPSKKHGSKKHAPKSRRRTHAARHGRGAARRLRHGRRRGR
jgi:hypothetical protein